MTMADSKTAKIKNKTKKMFGERSTTRKKVIRAFIVFAVSAIVFVRVQVNILSHVKDKNDTFINPPGFKQSSIFNSNNNNINLRMRGSDNNNYSSRLMNNKVLNVGQIYNKDGKKKDVVSSLEARTIRTFYHDIGNEEQREQIEFWKKAWSDSGWKVKVLGLEDAKRHPLYNVLKERIDKLDMCSNPDFQRLCFIRWLAMAIDGGGWMCDYDILPLDFEPPLIAYDNSYYLPPQSEQGQEELVSDEIIIGLPNGGKFTSHSLQLAPLTSASQDEITKMLILMLNVVEEHSVLRTRGRECEGTGKWQITDQESLLIIQSEIMDGNIDPDSLFFTRPKLDPGLTIHADDMIQRLSNNENDCSPEYKAVHFSGRHRMLKRNVRLNYMNEFYQTWKDECSNTRTKDSPEKRKAIEEAKKKLEGLRVINSQFRLKLDVRWQKKKLKNENYNFAFKKAFAKHKSNLIDEQNTNAAVDLPNTAIINDRQINNAASNAGDVLINTNIDSNSIVTDNNLNNNNINSAVINSDQRNINNANQDIAEVNHQNIIVNNEQRNHIANNDNNIIMDPNVVVNDNQNIALHNNQNSMNTNQNNMDFNNAQNAIVNDEQNNNIIINKNEGVIVTDTSDTNNFDNNNKQNDNPISNNLENVAANSENGNIIVINGVDNDPKNMHGNKDDNVILVNHEDNSLKNDQNNVMQENQNIALIKNQDNIQDEIKNNENLVVVNPPDNSLKNGQNNIMEANQNIALTSNRENSIPNVNNNNHNTNIMSNNENVRPN